MGLCVCVLVLFVWGILVSLFICFSLMIVVSYLQASNVCAAILGCFIIWFSYNLNVTFYLYFLLLEFLLYLSIILTMIETKAALN